MENATALNEKFADLKKFIEDKEIIGMQFLEDNELNKIARSNLLIEGQALPMFVVVNDSVYSFIQVHLASGVSDDKKTKVLQYLNEMNARFNMLKYCINSDGNIVLSCSVPASDDHFEPGLIIALIDQMKKHLNENYGELMKKVWA